MTTSVRLAGVADAPALAALRWRWRVDERGEIGKDRHVFEADFASWMSERRDSHWAWLSEVDGVPIGMAWLAIIHRVPGPGHWLRLAGNLQSVYVLPDHREKGAGTLLVAAVLAEAQARGLAYISVHPSVESLSLYRRSGFEETPGVLELRWDNVGSSS